jgi:diguanylate cyclase (GGDEF)-like protein
MSDNQVTARKPARRNKPILSIRARLIVLALLAITPLMLERVHGLENARNERTERAHTDVIELARRGAEAQREIIYSVRALLQIVSRVYVRMPAESANCNEFMAALTTNIPWIRNLAVAGTDGRIKCSTDPTATGLNVSDRSYYREALNSREFALSDYLISRLNQAPSVVATYPAIADNGAVDGVVMAVINLEWIGELAATAAQHSGASVLLLDGNGSLIAENAVHSGIDRELDIAYLQLGLFGMFVLLVAWFGGEQLVVRPIRSLVRTAARFGRGDLHARATQEPWVAEFEPLAVALDDMAAKLAEREEELQIANAHLDELASLDGLSGLANRRGFDRELEREWRHAGERGEPLGLMMVDIDHFKLFNDRYGHVAGDTCLRAVGETLSLVTLEHAVLVARYGGEEFALLLPGLTIERATAIAEEARQAVEDLLISHSESPCGHVTVSIGVESMVPDKFQSAADLVEAADVALYDAKRRGRNTVIAHLPAAHRAAAG